MGGSAVTLEQRVARMERRLANLEVGRGRSDAW